MKRKVVSRTVLTPLIISMLALTFNVQPVKASGTIYIKADGSVEGTDKIQRDGDIYTFIDNIYDFIVVQRDNIVVDGAGYAVQGTGWGAGIDMVERHNVTIKNIEIKAFNNGIWLYGSSNNMFFRNNILDNANFGIVLTYSSNNTLFGNNVTNNINGIGLWYSSNNNTVAENNILRMSNGVAVMYSLNNTLSRNNIIDNYFGVWLYNSSNNILSENNVTSNDYLGILGDSSSSNTVSGNNVSSNSYVGIRLDYSDSNKNVVSDNIVSNNNYGIFLASSANNNMIWGNKIEDNNRGIYLSGTSGNMFFHNNFVGNTQQVVSYDSTNLWDDGYPSGGNYWSDYIDRYPDAQELDDSGIWDTPYVIDANNRDNYPLIEPWTPLPRTIGELKTKIEELGSEGEIDNQGIVNSLIAKLNTVQKLVDKGKIKEAKTILEEDFIPQVQNLSEIHITLEAADILIESAEYIISNL